MNTLFFRLKEENMKGIASYFLTALTLCSTVCSLDISNLNNCVVDIKQALAKEEAVTLFSTNYAKLMIDLKTASVRNAFPVVYQQQVFDPFVQYLEKMGEWNFNTLFTHPANNSQSAFLQQIIPDISEAILQNGKNFAEAQTNAFQEVVSDLYNGFLGQEERRSKETGQQIKPPDRGVLPPIVKWGNPDAGPYTWPADATGELNIHSAIVSLPPAHLKKGILAWTALPHEIGGHDILHADNGLIDELAEKVYSAVMINVNHYTLANYWKQCVDETASDVLGLLNTGPTTGIGLIGYFRGLTGGPLRSVGAMPPGDTHPVDILRAFIAARVISQSPFSGAKDWSAAIRTEALKDLKSIYLVDSKGRYTRLPQDKTIQSAEIVADVIANTKLKSLEGHSLREIQDWTDEDQKIVDTLALQLRDGKELSSDFRNNGYYAAHVVAAAVQEALRGGANIQLMFDRMVSFLSTMHQYNTVWNPVSSLPKPCICTCPCNCCIKCQQQKQSTAVSLTAKPLAHVLDLNELKDLNWEEVYSEEDAI